MIHTDSPRELDATSAKVAPQASEPSKAATSSPKRVAAKTPGKKPASNKAASAKAAPAKPAVKRPATGAKPAANAQKNAVVAKGKPAAPAKPIKESKSKKPAPKKPKLVRDSFTFPEDDYAMLASLKQRALSVEREIKKSELLRAGLAALMAMSEAALLAALDGVKRIKTGRPAK